MKCYHRKYVINYRAEGLSRSGVGAIRSAIGYIGAESWHILV